MATKTEAENLIDQAKEEFKLTTASGSHMTAASGPDMLAWPAGHWLNGARLLDQAKRDISQLIDPDQPAPTPPPTPPPPSTDPVPQPEPPAFTSKRTLAVATTWTDVQNALSNLQPGDLLPVKGVEFPLQANFAKHLSAPAEIHFDSACKAPGGKARHSPAIWVEDCVNLRLTSDGMPVTNSEGTGIQIGGASGCVIDGFDVHSLGGAGFGANPTNAPIKDVYVRSAINNWGTDPTLDNHPEKGTGIHGLLVESSHTAYGVDGLTVVLKSMGSKVGGSLLEVGSDVSTNAPKNVVAWLHVEDFLGYTVQSDGSLGECKIQTAGNALNAYGYVSSLRVLWIYAKNIHGYGVHSYPYNNGSNYNVTIEAGHAENCCLNPRYKGQNPWQQNHAKYSNPGALYPTP